MKRAAPDDCFVNDYLMLNADGSINEAATLDKINESDKYLIYLGNEGELTGVLQKALDARWNEETFSLELNAYMETVSKRSIAVMIMDRWKFSAADVKAKYEVALCAHNKFITPEMFVCSEGEDWCHMQGYAEIGSGFMEVVYAFMDAKA